MGLSKSSRIITLLAIDTAFFLLELIVGYAVHSLALVADSFHMLNDILSLCVGLWAVKVANQTTNSKMYTYGWQRAETLGALVNGVFLVALCVTIFLDAIQRFVEPQVVSNPKLVLIVGCLGLGSNILGLFLFHEHNHSHGPEGHSHGPNKDADEIREAEEGHAHSHEGQADTHVADETVNVADVLPQNTVVGWPTTQSINTVQTKSSESTAVEEGSPLAHRASTGSRFAKRRQSRSASRSYTGIEDIPINPGAFRNSIIYASRLDDLESEEGTDTENPAEHDPDDTHNHTDEHAPLNGTKSKGYGAIQRKSIDHKQHKHAQPKEPGKGHGHSHGDLNMRGIFLHVMGDALGNIGVIVTALIIWLTKYSWRYYFDPAISLVITVIILGSAIPLCKAASRILLQAVPAGIDVGDIQDDIEDLPGILSCHHLHVWQLSDTKLVASLHVQVGFDFQHEGSARYMQLAQAIRQCLHEYGIHSSTIQPEFCLDPDHDHSSPDEDDHHDHSHDGAHDTHLSTRPSKPGSKMASKAGSMREPDACLLECGEECGGGKSCCSPLKPKDSHNGHDHAH